MEYYGNRLCISMRDLVDGGIMSEPNYKQLASRGRIDVVRKGGGKGHCALVAVDSLPKRFADKIDGCQVSPFTQWFETTYALNQQALAFYMDSNLHGKKINCSKAMTLATNASLLDCLIKIQDNFRIVQSIFGGRTNWDIICGYLKVNKSKYRHALPLSRPRLLIKLRLYRQYGFSALISQRFGNQNARKK